jgi:outer membrane receptor protein involved in Fe transport
MRALTILVLLLSTIVYQTAGQGKTGILNGNVQDAKGAALEAVTVTLQRNTDTTATKQATTDKNGQFQLNNIPFGKYILSVTHVGFANYHQLLEVTRTKPATTLRPISLQATEAALDLVTVVGRRPPIENRMDRTVVNVEASPTNSGLTALEVLEKSPGVMVDNDGNVSLKGKSGVVIMIDGKPTYLSAQDLTSYLKNMPATQLDQIEIMSQPPAKYDAAGNAGVINLITKKNKNYGFNATLTLSAILAHYFKSPNSLTFNWRQGNVNIYGNYSYSWWEGFSNTDGNNSQRTDATTPFDRYTLQHSYGRYSDRGQSFRTGIDYFANKMTTWGFSINGTIDKESVTSWSTTDFDDSTHNFVQYNLAQSVNKTPEFHLGFNGNYTHKLDTKGSEFSVDADYIFYNNQGNLVSDNYLYNADNTPSDAPYLLNGQLPAHINIYSFKSDYKKVLTKDITLEAGVKSSYVRTDNNAIYTLYDDTTQSWQADTGISNHFIYKENINAAYINWQQAIGKLGVQLGVRAEQTNASGDQTIKSVDFKTSYLQFFPTAYFTYKSDDDNTFGISYGRRIERPSYESLNPFRFEQDRYDYQQGNPNLQPQYSNNVEASYNYKGEWNLSANYTMTTNIISDAVITFKEPGDSNYTTYETSENLASQRNIGLSVNYSKQLTKAWTFNAFLNVFNNHYRGVVDSTNVDVSYTSFTASFNTQYKFKKGWGTEVSGFYYAKNYVSGVVLVDGRGMFSLGGSKQIWHGKGTLKLVLRDPLYLMNYTSHSDLAQGLVNSRTVWDNRRIIMTFVYRFGRNTNQVQHHNSGASDEQDRVGSSGNGNQ